MPFRFALLPLLLLLSHLDADAQGAWWEIPPPFDGGAGTAGDFARSDVTGSIVTFASENHTTFIYRSVDDGVSWERGDSLPQASILECDNGIFWVCSADGTLRRSLDDGLSWQRVASIRSFSAAYKDFFVDGSHLIVGGYRSTDCGATWDTLASGAGRASHTFRLGDLLIVQNSSLHSSADNGASWRRLPSRPLPDKAIDYATAIGDTILAFSTFSERLYVSGDTGRTWQQRGHRTWGDATRFIATDTELFALTASSAILRTTDHGLSWQRVMDTLLYSQSLFVHDSLWLSGTAGVHRSTDGGASWRQTGLSRSRINRPNAMYRRTVQFNGDTIWVVSNDHLYSRPLDEEHYTVRAFMLSIGDFRLPAPGVLEISSDFRIHRTTDGGRSWSMGERDFRTGSFPLRVGPWLFTQEFLSRSSDDGATWQSLDQIISPQIDGGPNFLVASDTVLIVMVDSRSDTGSDALYRSTDYGESWSRINGPVIDPHLYYAVQSGDTLLFGNRRTIYRTVDHGETWDSVMLATPPDETIVTFTYRNGLFVVITYINRPGAETEGRILYSRDDGATWDVAMEGIREEQIGGDPFLSFLDMFMTWGNDDLYLYAPFLYRLDRSTLSIDRERQSGPVMMLTAAPNPADGEVRLHYTLDRREHVRITLHDLLGRPLSRPVDGMQEPGEHQVTIDAGSIGDGMVICTLHAGDRSASIPIRVLR